MFDLGRDKDTICAIATPPGVGGIAVIRVSGDSALSITQKICPFLPQTPESHRVFYGYLVDNSQQDVDEVLVSYFKTGRSFTGEETIEISCHGGKVVSSEIIECLLNAGCRMAQAGEFTYRAFMNGRIDLVQAESVLQLIESESKKGARLSLRQLKGQVSTALHSIVDDLTLALAHLEANIDFAAEDIVIEELDSLRVKVESVHIRIQELLASYRSGRILKEGLKIVLCGEPNVGKSSLLNRLSGEEKAIVTDIPGTTRDIVENSITYKGVSLNFMDTAGLRLSEDIVEQKGIQKALNQLDEADLILLVLDSQTLNVPDSVSEILHSLAGRLYVVCNKSDLVKPSDYPELKTCIQEKMAGLLGGDHKWDEGRVLFVSASSELVGVTALFNVFDDLATKEFSENSAAISQARHFELLVKAEKSVTSGLSSMGQAESPDLIALDLHGALRALYEILGQEFDDEVMDRVFKEFCLGK